MSFDTELARRNMVEQQVRGWNVSDNRVRRALAAIPRETFVPAAWRELAFADVAVPLEHGETMMKPIIEGRTLQAIALGGNEDVLEIGTGSGYLTACISRLAHKVTSIECHADLAAGARQRVDRLGIDNVEIEVAEAVHAWQARRQFDVVVVTGAVAEVPARWFNWIKPGGRLFAIVGHAPAMVAELHETTIDRGEFIARQLFDTELPYLLHAAPAPVFAL